MKRERRVRVFVYGSLQRGECNHSVIESAEFLGCAQTSAGFTLYDLGPFPALVTGGDASVAGELYEVDEDTLSRLDRLEGHPRFYQRVSLKLDDGSIAFAYLQQPDQVLGRRRVRSGDWKRHRKEERCEFV